MKKLLIMTGVLLAVTASMASATGVDLNWNQCLANATVRNQDKGFICDESSPGAGDANTMQFIFYGSVRTGVNIPGVLSYNAQVDIQVANPALDPWWDPQCRPGALGFSFSGFPTSPFNEVAGCNGQLTPSSVSVGALNYAPTGPNRAQLSMVVSRTTPVTAFGTVKYALFRALMDSRFTKLDPTDPVLGDHECAGCLDQACLVLNHVELDIAPTPGDDGKRHFFSPEIADFITWQGGNIGGTGCPAATPTKKATWGQVKSLYR